MSMILDVGGMKEQFFGGSAMIGIATAYPGFRFCWLLNRHFGTSFANVPEHTICMGETRSGKDAVKYLGSEVQGSMFGAAPAPDGELWYFPTWCHQDPNSGYSHLLYQLKHGKKVLLPEVKHLDFLWLIQTAEPQHDAHLILASLRQMPSVQLAQELTREQLKKSMANLLL
jgi:hypothetical protein